MLDLIHRFRENRSLLICLLAVSVFTALLGCGGGGGGSDSTPTTNASTNATTNATTTATTTSETTGTTGSSLPENRIFFADAAYDIRHIAPDGGDERVYVDMSESFQGFAQNPLDPGKVAFGVRVSAGDRPQYSIFANSAVSTAGATPLVSSTFSALGSIQFTPDGTKIVFTAATSDVIEPDYRLYIIDSSTPNQTPAPLDHADDAYVSPTGNKIVYTCWPLDATGPRIKVCQMDGSGQAFLTGSSYFSYLPQFDKTGATISFGSTQSGQFEIWKMASDGSAMSQVTRINGDQSERCYGSSWSPDGSEIVFTRITPRGDSGIYKVSKAGGDSEVLRPGGVQTFIYWSPLDTSALSGPHHQSPTLSYAKRLQDRLNRLTLPHKG